MTRREITFRGKCIRGVFESDWVYGSYVLSDEDDRGDSHSIVAYTGASFEVDPSTIGQYTGLEDKKGKPIFEGDIVRDDKGLSVIHFMTPQFVCVDENGKPWNLGGGTVHKDSHKLEVTEVIGNVYDNSELLTPSHD